MYIAKIPLKMSQEVTVPPAGSENGWQLDSKRILALFKCCVDTGRAGREDLEVGDEGLWGQEAARPPGRLGHGAPPQEASGSYGSLSSVPRAGRAVFVQVEKSGVMSGSKGLHFGSLKTSNKGKDTDTKRKRIISRRLLCCPFLLPQTAHIGLTCLSL